MRQLARWDGTAWTALDDVQPTSTGWVDALLVTGVLGAERLVIGGAFVSLGGLPAMNVGSFDGASFARLGSGLSSFVYDVAAFDSGLGSSAELIAAGDFSAPGGGAHLARWNGGAWAGLGDGLDARARALLALDAGGAGGAALFVGGQFMNAGLHESRCVALLRADCSGPSVFCAGDGSATACPCGNAGATDHGCGSSSISAGALLAATGTPSVSSDTLALVITSVPNGVLTFFQGTTQVAGGNGAPLGDGLRCAGGTVVRLGSVFASGNTATYPGPGQQSVSERGDIPPAGGERYYQVWYRDSPPFCASATFNASNGLAVVWTP